MKDCPAVLKTLSLLVIGFLLVILAVSLTLRGQNSTNSTVVRVDRIQGVNPTEMFVEDEFIAVSKRGIRAGFRVGRGPLQHAIRQCCFAPTIDWSPFCETVQAPISWIQDSTGGNDLAGPQRPLQGANPAWWEP